MSSMFSFFFFNDTATTEIYTLSLHDALPISKREEDPLVAIDGARVRAAIEWKGLSVNAAAGRIKVSQQTLDSIDRKSTRLNSSHSQISYAVFCLKKKKHTDILPLASTHTMTA